MTQIFAGASRRLADCVPICSVAHYDYATAALIISFESLIEIGGNFVMVVQHSSFTVKRYGVVFVQMAAERVFFSESAAELYFCRKLSAGDCLRRTFDAINYFLWISKSVDLLADIFNVGEDVALVFSLYACEIDFECV